MQPTLSDVESLARQAGEILRAGIGLSHKVDYKGAIDLVTEVDHRSEAHLLGEIRRMFPGHRILAEESGAQSGDNCCIWIVDPLDGTVNYAHGVPIYGVSIAFQVDGATTLGVVYDPTRDECFSAQLGHGAWLNGAPVQVSQTSQLNDSLLVTGFSYDIRTNPNNNLDHFSRLSLLTQGVRRLGSAALDLCYVACGRFDGFWELRLSPWDVAAGALIAQEAGAKVTDIHGGSNFLAPHLSIVAAAPLLHPWLLATLQGE